MSLRYARLLPAPFDCILACADLATLDFNRYFPLIFAATLEAVTQTCRLLWGSEY